MRLIDADAMVKEIEKLLLEWEDITRKEGVASHILTGAVYCLPM